MLNIYVVSSEKERREYEGKEKVESEREIHISTLGVLSRGSVGERERDR